MKKGLFRKGILLFGCIFAVALIVTGCTNKEAAETAETNKETVLVGTGAYPRPYTYEDDNGKLKGFDIDSLRAIFKGSDEYTVDFQKGEFESVLAGVDTDRYQIGANAFSKTAEREEKYLFSKPVYRNPLGLVVPKDSTIDSIDDIAGLTTTGEAAVSYSIIIQKYNETHADNPVTLNYTDKDLSLQFQDVADGKSDFKLESAIIAKYTLESHGLDKDLKVIELPEDAVKDRSAFSYYIFPKNESGEKLVKYVNERIEAVREDGTLKKLSETYFSGDFVPTEAEFNSK
ncbi:MULTISPECIES: transporter substrate-binding domain-containing protein [unclassified Enterococcus]|uniref:transporter substrate-binding domain-containing protein n=1 Tax=unclassified Enterococcus TaxID=2608891 RepID=UPI0015564DE7|nr:MULTISPECIES: transporter substrate-binding domain-containing protein [unclassified Enterococcus]MBS7576581.1 transporter substrate-binding domain-containing protein [Enterococcus sp. MMGLQ5-2]MBS7583932.1 transporter substrate-binding domain-containing protein [Enterococcus sp. MMGLQ5-1]NPD11793.1 transporter substrate-binding domain-containing protein [Enterococcus sp. MMGLQ5-1]NPD36418.1 transporter substrate-binding domain-containing protein [Enterococcus sp. MMGLQ5-2]